MKNRSLRSFLLLAAFAAAACQALAQDATHATPCSTEKVNGDCKVTIDRTYPVAMPPIQMRRGEKLSVDVVNTLPFESLTLDLQSAQAVAGTDQTAAFLNAAPPMTKGALETTHLFAEAEGQTLPPVPSAVDNDLNDLRNRLAASKKLADSINTFFENAATVYSQLREILSPVPRPAKHDQALVRAKEVVDAGTPNPWRRYSRWRDLLLCELIGDEPNNKHCTRLGTDSTFQKLLGDVSRLQSELTASTCMPADDSSKTPDPCLNAAKPPIFSHVDFKRKADTAKANIESLSSSEEKGRYSAELKRLTELESDLVSSASYDSAAVSNIAKELGTYYVNISRAEGPAPKDKDSDDPVVTQLLGEVHDPRDVPEGACHTNLLGCQVSFSVNAVNKVATSVTSVPAATQQKSIVTITVLYADPRFEVSAGAFFSTMPVRSFGTQTLVTPNAGAAYGNVSITQAVTRPAIVPFVAANWRLTHDGLWPDHRRRGFYFSVAVGLNPYNTTTEVAAGPSLSWRSIMVSALFHWGHDVRLTQGESVDEVLCNSYGPPPGSSILKCPSGSQSPSTEKFWRGAFALGVSVRVPSIFGTGNSSGGSGSSGH